MKDSLAAFLRSMTALRQYVSNIRKKNSLLDQTLELSCASEDIKTNITVLQSVRSEEKQFDYTVTIVSLYGQYETFIEQLIKEYIRELRIENYRFSDLPQQIQDGYFVKSAKLQTKIEWEKYSSITEKVISKSLYDTLNLDTQNILPEAFYTNAGNYKIKVLVPCLNELGIENLKQLLCNYPPLQKYYKSKYGDDVNMYEKDDVIRYGLIDEVVDTRNKIAHTGTIDEIKDSSYVSEIFDFFEAFACSLNMFIQDILYEIKWGITSKPSYKPDNYFERNGVVSFQGDNLEVHLNQEFMCKYPDGHFPQFTLSKVLGIQYDGKDYDSFVLKAEYPDGVGLKISPRISLGCRFMFL